MLLLRKGYSIKVDGLRSINNLSKITGNPLKIHVTEYSIFTNSYFESNYG